MKTTKASEERVRERCVCVVEGRYSLLTMMSCIPKMLRLRWQGGEGGCDWFSSDCGLISGMLFSVY